VGDSCVAAALWPPEQIAETCRQPCIPLYLVESISDEVVSECVSALWAGEDRLRWIKAVNRCAPNSKIVKIGVEGVTLVAKHHQAVARWAAKRIQVFITAAPEAAGVEIGFVDEWVLWHGGQ
jgi:hypothetical protein